MTTTIYAGGLTDDQDLRHQRENLLTYTTDVLGIPVSESRSLPRRLSAP